MRYYVLNIIMYVRCLSNSQNTNLENLTYVILSAIGKEADFLYSTVCRQIYPTLKVTGDKIL